MEATDISTATPERLRELLAAANINHHQMMTDYRAALANIRDITAKLAKVEKERDEALTNRHDAHADLLKDAAEDQALISALQARVAQLEGALRPFAKAGELFKDEPEREWDACIYRPAAGREYELGGKDLKRAYLALAKADTWPTPDAHHGECGR